MTLKRTNTIFKLFKNISILIFFCFSVNVFSQDKPIVSAANKDTLTSKVSEKEIIKTARHYFSKKEYDNASFFLSKFYNHFPESLELNWLYAYVLSLNNNKNGAIEKFKKAISIAPNNADLQSQYAKFLYENGETDELEIFLSSNVIIESKDVDFLLMQAKVSFWNGDFKKSQKKLDRIQEIHPDTEITKDLANQIKELTSYYLRANFEYQTDSQPMDYFAQHIILEKYISKFLNPKLEISNYNFSPLKEQALIIKLNNQSHFNNLGLKVNLTGGVYKNFSGETDWIGGIHFKKRLGKKLSLNFGYSKNSVLTTIASTTFNLTKQDFFGEFDYNNKLISFHAAYNQQFYKDENNIVLFGGWIISQPLKIQKFNFQAGYGYNFSDSKNNLFIYDNQGIGVYDPYFTPKEQEVHSGLFITNYKPTKNLTLEAKLNYGFKANVQNPYKNEFDNEIGGFYEETFNYIDYSGAINYTFSNSFNMNAIYIYQETFFYNRNNISLGLNYTF